MCWVSSTQMRSPTWSADLRDQGDHLYVKEKQNIVPRNYLESGVPDAVNLPDKPVVNDDDTPGSAQSRPQKVANVISFSALSNMHTQLGHASAEAMLRFLEGGILPAGVDSITRADIKRVISNCTLSASAFDPNLYAPGQLFQQTSSSTNQSTLMFSTLMDILCC
jgi:hypothetical protein